MYKFLAIVNAAIVLSFAASALVAPEVIFALFGIRLNGFGAVVARGYAAALIGYGLMMWFVRNVEAMDMRQQVLLTGFIVNGAEVFIQLFARLNGLAERVIWLSVFMHACLALMSLVEMVIHVKIRKDGNN